MTEQETQKTPEPPQIVKDLTEILSSEAGIRVFRELMLSCGYQRSSLAIKQDGSLDVTGTHFNEGRRDVWLGIRNLIQPEQRVKIENQ